MANSKAKKQRMKREREGYINPEMIRGGWGLLSPHERKTPTLAGKLLKQSHKHKQQWNHLRGDRDDSIVV